MCLSRVKASCRAPGARGKISHEDLSAGVTCTMRSHPIIHEIVNSNARNQMIDITDRVSKLVQQRGVKEGVVIIFVPHHRGLHDSGERRPGRAA